MDLKRWLFDGGDKPYTPPVKFAKFVGGGDCEFCGFYRVLILLIASLLGNIVGYSYGAANGLGSAIGFLIFVFVLFKILEKKAEKLPDDDPSWGKE